MFSSGPDESASNGRHALAWSLTIAFVVGLLVFDFVFHVRKAPTPTLSDAARWSAVYVGIALIFAGGRAGRRRQRGRR